MTKTRVQHQWMTRTEAALTLGVSTRTIKRRMDAGKLPFKRDPRSGRVAVKVAVAPEEEAPTQ
jgi:excisionase family DNA binding protein